MSFEPTALVFTHLIRGQTGTTSYRGFRMCGRQAFPYPVVEGEPALGCGLGAGGKEAANESLK
jgi:hypothetical protein